MAAHRGASGYAPENTLPAFQMALAMKSRFIELDVQMSSDGEIIVIHDPRVDRTTEGKGSVGSLTLAQLKALDAGSWFNRRYPKKARSEFTGARIPLLQEVLDLVRGAEAGLYIEIKGPELYPPDFESKVISILREYEFEKRVVLLSFSAGSVKKVKRLEPRIRTALLQARSIPDPVSAAVAVDADELALRHSLLTPAIMQKAGNARLGVVVWTVNTEKAMQRAIASGVDCIISNYPDRVLRLLVE